MKYFFPLLFFVLIACSGSSNRPYSQKMVESLSLRTFNNNRNTSTLQQADFSYVPGLVAKSVLKTFELYPDKRQYYESVKAYADRQLRDDPAAPLKISDDDIDAINAGKIFFDLYKQSVKDGDTESADKYKAAATFMYNKLKNEHTRILAPKPGAGGFIHKGRYPDQMWLDGLYMGAAFYAEWEATFGESGNTESWSDIAYQFKTIHQYTWEEKAAESMPAASPTDSNSFGPISRSLSRGASKNSGAEVPAGILLTGRRGTCPKNMPTTRPCKIFIRRWLWVCNAGRIKNPAVGFNCYNTTKPPQPTAWATW